MYIYVKNIHKGNTHIKSIVNHDEMNYKSKDAAILGSTLYSYRTIKLYHSCLRKKCLTKSQPSIWKNSKSILGKQFHKEEYLLKEECKCISYTMSIIYVTHDSDPLHIIPSGSRDKTSCCNPTNPSTVHMQHNLNYSNS